MAISGQLGRQYGFLSLQKPETTGCGYYPRFLPLCKSHSVGYARQQIMLPNVERQHGPLAKPNPCRINASITRYSRGIKAHLIDNLNDSLSACEVA